MAHGYLQHFGGDGLEVFSAGVETHGVNPRAIQVMAEDGIDISGHTSNNILEYQGIPFDYVITVCDHARERCPFFPGGAVTLHHDFPDPAKAKGTDEEVMHEFRRVRDLVRGYCLDFIRRNIVT